MLRDELEEPFHTLELNQGDLLYFPRGVIHQAFTDHSLHSMHATLSTMQRWTWRDYFEKVLMAGLAYAFAEDDEWRRVLPRGFFQAMGAVHADTTDNAARTEI